MKATIENAPVFTTLSVALNQGESIRAEGGAMVSMSPGIELKSKTQGKGLGGILKSAIGGEGIFVSEFTANEAGEVVLAGPTPGDILEIALTGNTIMAQGGAYLAGSLELELGTKGSFKALMSGEGLFLQTIKGNGTVYLSCFGAIMHRTLASGESYVVDSGHVLAFEESVQYRVKKAAKGLFSTVASGEGLVAEFTGPGSLWIQSRQISNFASVIGKLLPKRG